MQFKLSELRLTCLQVQWWRKKSWALKWQVLTDHVSIKNLQFLLYQRGKTTRSCLGHSLDYWVYRWKHGHFARLGRTQWRDQALSMLAFVNEEVVFCCCCQRFFDITVASHYTCDTKLAVKLCQSLMKFDRIVSIIKNTTATTKSSSTTTTTIKRTYEWVSFFVPFC